MSKDKIEIKHIPLFYRNTVGRILDLLIVRSQDIKLCGRV